MSDTNTNEEAVINPNPPALITVPPSVELVTQQALDTMDLLDQLSGHGESSFDDLVGAVTEAPPDGMDVLKALSGAKEGEATASGSYGYDKALAESGKMFAWPKLGPIAKLKLCKIGCRSWKAVADRARELYAGEDGSIKPSTMDKILAGMMVKSVFVDMEGVVIEVGAPPLVNSDEARLRLLEAFDGLRDEIFKACNNPKNFRDLSEKVLGN